MDDYIIRELSISQKEFRLLSELIYEKFGIRLTEQKRPLILNRLSKTLRKLGFKSFTDYYQYVLSDSSGNELSNLINSISTNHTFFYREEKHFDFFKKVGLPETIEELIKKKSRDLRVWSAGCSSGEEAYMLAILMLEYFGNEYALWDAGVLATDISQRVLDQAEEGIYAENKISKMPKSLLNKYFVKLKDDNWKVIDKIKKQVIFRRFNLQNEAFPFKRPFHVIFCRNVMIYFDRNTRNELIKKFYQFMEPGGFLFIGHSESIGREQEFFRYIQPAVYQRSL